MEKREKIRTAGFVIAIAGLFVACASVVPGLFRKGDVPWTIFVGSFVYLHGAFMVLIGSRGPDQKRHLGALRFIRLGFVLVFAILVWQLFAP